eukprot:TRINITY_DN1486_c0_g1_i2.p1 TRINITY_DN1486_c0_g1~~TRINITY_DN1486_c0_g1_i2.p1  ORF type:complete len:300 (+),score=48.62 TRINITY_DN1486_c0_g1_i2:163-1062(+)
MCIRDRYMAQNDSELDQSQIENGVTEIEHGTITGLDVAKVLIRRLGPKDPQVNPVFGKGQRIIFELYQNIEDFLGKEQTVVYDQREDIKENEDQELGVNNYRFMQIEKYQQVTKAGKFMPEDSIQDFSVGQKKDVDQLELIKINSFIFPKVQSNLSIMSPILHNKKEDSQFFNVEVIHSQSFSSNQNFNYYTNQILKDSSIDNAPQQRQLAQLYEASENSEKVQLTDRNKSKFAAAQQQQAPDQAQDNQSDMPKVLNNYSSNENQKQTSSQRQFMSNQFIQNQVQSCLLYTSPSPRDQA